MASAQPAADEQEDVQPETCPHGIPSIRGLPCTKCVQGGWRPPFLGGGSIKLPEETLRDWWQRTSQNDINKTEPKAVEYGSEDIGLMGDAMGRLLRPEGAEPNPRLDMEMACWFYALGKVARAISSYRKYQPASDDTWFDLGVYSIMARKIRETGRWP